MSQADHDFKVLKKSLIQRLDDLDQEVKESKLTGEEALLFLNVKIAQLKEVTTLLMEAYSTEANRKYRGVEFGHNGGT